MGRMSQAQLIESIPDSLGSLVLNQDGAVISSSGDLENDEKLADKMMTLVQTAVRLPMGADGAGSFRKLAVTWDNYLYCITVSNQKVFVIKRKYVPPEPLVV